MMRFLIVIIMAWCLAGCSPLLKSGADQEQLLSAERSLWQLTIGNPEKPKFTGLLALRSSEAGIEAVLLDSTGIKLLAERIGPDGAIALQSAISVVSDKGLPAFLGKGLHRIFQPATKEVSTPCRQDFLVRSCFGENVNGQLVNSGSFGPFELWSVEYLINKDNRVFNLSGVVLNSGWFTPSLRLDRKVMRQ